MRYVIYDYGSLIGANIGTVLTLDHQVGPKISDFAWNIRDFDDTDFNQATYVIDRDESEYSGHFNTIQVLENEPLRDGNVTFLDGYFEALPPTKHQIWFNWFGHVSHKHFKINNCDKLILCNPTPIDLTFDYAMTSAFKKIPDIAAIEYTTHLWDIDHVLVEDTSTSDWQRIWYDHFHEQTKRDFVDGKLIYFFQLNRLHWDVYKNPDYQTIKMRPANSAEELIKDFYNDSQDIRHIGFVRNSNPNSLIVNRDWYNNISDIEDYLEYKFNDIQLENIERLKQFQETRFNSFLDKYGRIF